MYGNKKQSLRNMAEWLIDDEELDWGDLSGPEPQTLNPATLDEGWPDPEEWVAPVLAPPRRARTRTRGLERARRLQRMLARVRN